MEKPFFQLFFHLDQSLLRLMADYGWCAYLLLSCIIFLETALVFLPFLPGDSLLFTAGTFVSVKALSLSMLLTTLITAATLGAQMNYLLGNYCSTYLLEKIRWHRRIKNNVLKIEPIFQRYGGSILIWARFLPLLRTVVPFIAGMTHLPKQATLVYNFIGAVVWVGGLIGAGACLGRLPIVQNHLTSWIGGILGVSVLCTLYSYRRIQRQHSQVNSF